MKADNQKETVAESQPDAIRKKLKKVFGHLNPLNPPEVCPVRDILSPVSDKWSILIFVFLGIMGVLRFNELKKYIHGISAKILAERLKALEQDGYVKRKVYAEVPVRVEYELTTFGYEYIGRLVELIEWLNISLPEILKKRHEFGKIINENS